VFLIEFTSKIDIIMFAFPRNIYIEEIFHIAGQAVGLRLRLEEATLF